jgi:dihydrofolate synthase/folylpolyglutamate synthase
MSSSFEGRIKLLPTYKGRREIMTFNGKSLIFIGAHNIDGVRRMLEDFQHRRIVLEGEKQEYPSSVLLSFSLRPENEVAVMLKSMTDFFQGEPSLTLTSFDHPKALSSEVIQKIAKKVNKGMLNFVPDWKTYLQNNTPEKSTILVCGSYYFIGEVQRFIRL